jgi:hypothetical protein
VWTKCTPELSYRLPVRAEAELEEIAAPAIQVIQMPLTS